MADGERNALMLARKERYHMPKWLEAKIEKEYEKKGKSPKKAKEIAYKTLNKLGKLHKKK